MTLTVENQTLTTLLTLGEEEIPSIRTSMLPGVDMASLEAAELLKAPVDLKEVICDCETGMLAKVVLWAGSKSALKICPNCGREIVARNEVRVWELNRPLWADKLAKALGKTCKKEIPGISWSLGRMGQTPVCWLSRFDRTAQKLIKPYYTSGPNTLFLVSNELRAEYCQTHFSFKKVLALSELIQWNDGQVVLDRSSIDPFLSSLSAHPTKSRPKRGERLNKLEKFESLLIMMLSSIYEQIVFDESNDKFPTVPPRPTQQEMAKKLKMSQSDISNCLRDKQGKRVKILWGHWSTAEEVKKISYILTRGAQNHL